MQSGRVDQGLTDEKGLLLRGVCACVCACALVYFCVQALLTLFLPPPPGPWTNVAHGGKAEINCAGAGGPRLTGGGMGRHAAYWDEVCLDHSALLTNEKKAAEGGKEDE